MKTKQGWFLIGINVIFSIVAIRWFERSWEQLGYMMMYVREGGGFGGFRDAGVWSITLHGREMVDGVNVVNAHFTNYPAIFFFILAGINIGLLLLFMVWNRLRADTDYK